MTDDNGLGDLFDGPDEDDDGSLTEKEFWQAYEVHELCEEGLLHGFIKCDYSENTLKLKKESDSITDDDIDWMNRKVKDGVATIEAGDGITAIVIRV
jgi:hypothetical protein